MGIEAVLFDADGVLQFIGTPWSQALKEGGGQEFATALLADEHDALSGRESLTALLDRLVAQLGLEVSTQDLLALWWRAAPDPAAWAVVRELRSVGITTVLATNQQFERRDWMRSAQGYDGLCDVDAYSCEVGACKPEAEYFRRVLAMADVSRPEAAVFVDDSAANVAAAAAVGIRTIHHPADAGAQVLRTELAQLLGPDVLERDAAPVPTGSDTPVSPGGADHDPDL